MRTALLAAGATLTLLCATPAFADVGEPPEMLADAGVGGVTTRQTTDGGDYVVSNQQTADSGDYVVTNGNG